MEIKQEIARLLNTITQQYKSVYLNKHKIPQIELDILKQNIRLLYDKFRELEEANENIPEDEPRVQFTNEFEHQNQDKDITTKVEFEGDPVEEKSEPSSFEKKTHREHKESTSEETKKEQQKKEESSKRSVADQYADEKKSINDRITSKQEDSSVASRLEKNPVNDLKAAIGINDKFLFVRELFGGDSDGYRQTIEHFNTLSDWKEALNYLNDLADKYNWDDDDPNYQRFYQIVSRKFS